MATIGTGYLGGFSGKLGTAIGYNWNGRWCLRSLPVRVHNPRTERQQRHRMMFREEVRLAARMAWPVTLALSELARHSGMTSYNLFVKLNQPAFGWADEALQVDWPALRLSTGPVAPVAFAAPVIDEHNTLSISFEKNPLRMHTDSLDLVHLFVYCPDLEQSCMVAPVYRHNRRIRMLLPDGFAGHELQLYAFVQDIHGQFSETIYIPMDEPPADEPALHAASPTEAAEGTGATPEKAVRQPLPLGSDAPRGQTATEELLE